jgi:hypothetical protein
MQQQQKQQRQQQQQQQQQEKYKIMYVKDGRGEPYTLRVLRFRYQRHEACSLVVLTNCRSRVED